MKVFFALVGISLAASTLTGALLALRASRARRRYALTLAAGVAVPAVLLML